MKYLAVETKQKFLRRLLKRDDDKTKDLSWLDKTILKGCKENALRIQQILHICKPYVNQWGTRRFATTDEVVASVRKLVKLELLREV